MCDQVAHRLLHPRAEPRLVRVRVRVLLGFGLWFGLRVRVSA